MKRYTTDEVNSRYTTGGWFIKSAEGNRTTASAIHNGPLSRTTEDVIADVKRVQEQLRRYPTTERE